MTALSRATEFLSGMGDDFPEELREPMAQILINQGAAVHESASDLDNTAPIDPYQLFNVVEQISRSEESYAVPGQGMHQVLADSMDDTTTYEGLHLNPEDTLHRAGRTVGFLEQARYEAIAEQARDDLDSSIRIARIENAAINATLRFVPYAGKYVAPSSSVIAGEWLSDEIHSIEENWSLSDHAVSDLRKSQLVELANIWYAAHGDFADSTPGFSANDGAVHEINDAADMARGTSEGEPQR